MKIVIIGAGLIGCEVENFAKQSDISVELIPARNIQDKKSEVFAALNTASHLIWAGRDVATIRKPEIHNRKEFLMVLSYLEERHFPLHFSYLSSGGAIYGNAKKLPTPENHSLAPISKYGIEKKSHEEIIQKIRDENSYIKTLTVRPSNIYSFDEIDFGLVPSLERALLNDIAMKFSGIEQVRDYIWITDFCELLIKFSQLELDETINIGSGEILSIKKLIDIFENIFNRQLQYDVDSMNNYDVLHSELDITKMNSHYRMEFRKLNELLVDRSRRGSAK